MLLRKRVIPDFQHPHLTLVDIDLGLLLLHVPRYSQKLLFGYGNGGDAFATRMPPIALQYT